MSQLVKDVVCGMEVNPHQYETHYLQMQFAFCSEQCRDRFVANPHLYIGRPGHPAPKQRGEEVIKKRRLRLASPLPLDKAALLIQALQAMMGVKSVVIEGDKLDITYDLLQATTEQIEAQMIDIGVRLGEDWAERLRRAFVHYEEECEIGNLEVDGKQHRV
jgi:YHS domain-containing protein